MASAVLLVTTDLLLAEDSVLIFSYLIIISAIITPKFHNYIHSTKDRGNQNSALLYVILKILTTIVTVYVLQRHSNTFDTITSLKTFFSSVMVPETMNLWFCVLIVSSSFLCQSVLYVTTYSIRTKLNIHLPMYLSAMIVSVVVLLSFLKIIDVSSISWLESLDRTQLDMKLSQTLIPLYVTIGGLLIIPIFVDFISNRNATHQRDINSFCNSVFPLQCISSMTSAFSSGNNTTSSCKKTKKRRIFICTTMYQESQIEMDRLLSSIKHVSVSDLLRRENIDIESHIFLDNGANGQDIKQFGLQLLALIEDNLVTDNEQGIMLFTPYGIQLSWQLGSGMPLFVHLKDVSKVKAKKRWSQVMYMKYVLSYRSFKCRNISGNLSKISSYASLLSVDSMASMGEKTKTVQNNLKVPESRVNNMVYDSDVNSAITETTSAPYVEIFVGDTSSVGNLSEKPDTANSIFTTTDTNNMYTDAFDLDTEEYILATDADMTFVDGSIMDVLHMCESDTQVGAVCGRTRPKGVHIHPIVWLQMFDYAKGKKHILISESDKYSKDSDLVFTNYLACIVTSFYPKPVTKGCSSVLIIDTFGIH